MKIKNARVVASPVPNCAASDFPSRKAKDGKMHMCINLLANKITYALTVSKKKKEKPSRNLYFCPVEKVTSGEKSPQLH